MKQQQPEEHIDAPPGIPHPERRPRRRRRRSDFLAGFGVREAQSLALALIQPKMEQQEEEDDAVQTRVTSLIDFDKFYFESYSHLGIHEEMIKDRVRTDAYKNAVEYHADSIRGKVVLDVGCGTGILAIFCAQAGAKRVYAVEASNIALQAKSVVTDNNLSNIIMVLHGRLEDVEINEKVDVIISEWMGYMLLYENMLGSVITARDRWLRPGGLILPSKATLYMTPFTHAKRYHEIIGFWNDVYGIDMSAMLPLAKQCAFEEPSVETITHENVLALPHEVKCVDCYSITIPELESVRNKFKFYSLAKAPLHGFAFWFDVDFNQPVSPKPVSFHLPGSSVDKDPVVSTIKNRRDPALLLSTAPERPSTHWKQTLIYFYNPIELEKNQLIEGRVTLSQSQDNARFLNINLAY
ncbi:putative protein arginine N-methyltransferase 6, partial [Mucuna pruriens]